MTSIQHDDWTCYPEFTKHLENLSRSEVPSVIARSPSLTDQVKAHLKERIVEGEFEEGRIPPETELATELGVSRTTVRDALSRLEHEGSIYPQAGCRDLRQRARAADQVPPRGDLVLRRGAARPRLHPVGQGASASNRTGGTRRSPTTSKIEDGEPVLVMEKLFLEDDDPVVLTYNRIPADVSPGRGHHDHGDRTALRLPRSPLRSPPRVLPLRDRPR